METIEEYGGEVWLNNGASRILVREGKVCGVMAEDGTEIATSYVVSNANPWVTSLELIGRDQLPDWYLRRLGAWTPGAATFNVYLGLDCTCEEIGLTTHENFVNRSYDLDRQYELMRAGIDIEPDGAAVTAYNVVDPWFSPPGTSSVVITLISYAAPWIRLSPPDYQAAKHNLADRLLTLAERVAPDIREHIEVVEIATPLTNMRFSGNPGGSIIGFDENFMGTGMDHLPNRSPLEGLYFAGAWANIGGGYEPCIFSGYLTSRQILGDMERGGRDAAVMERMRAQSEKLAAGAEELREESLAAMKARVEALHPKRVKLQVSAIIEETRSTKTLRMRAVEGELPHFRAGQYINLFLDIDGVLTSRPYSISSPPGKPYWDITVRRVEGGFVSHFLLDRVGVGDLLESTGPTGNFYYEPLMDYSDLVFLAGGSGVTPFASMIRDAVEKELPLKIHLIYGSRDPGDIIFAGELDRIGAEHENVRVDFVISEPHEEWNGLCGLLDAGMISSLTGTVEGKTFYICGPAPMYALCQAALESLGVPRRRIRREAYGPPADVSQDPDWPGIDTTRTFRVTEERSGRTIEAGAGEPLMNSLERAGIVVPAVCRAGECTYCRTKLVRGEIYAPPRVRRRWADERFGYIHPCMSYPLSDLVIRI
jgi:ferredoxin-NADP reductase